jgi:hypothetical protein
MGLVERSVGEADDGSTMFRYSKKSNTAGLGCSDPRTTVYLSGVSIDVNQADCVGSKPEAMAGWRTRRIFHLMSSLVNSRPE